MSNVIYLQMRGERQGNISAGCGAKESVGNRCQTEHTDEIFVFDLANSLTGTGKGCNLQTLVFSKLIDKSSPLLGLGISGNERFFLNFSFYRINPCGKWEKYYLIELRGATLTGIRANFKPGGLDTEAVAVRYEYIRCQHLTAKTEFYYLAFPAEYNQLFSRQNPIVAAQYKAEKEKPTREITLTIGVFFDGTGNNAVNTQNMLKVYSAGHYDLDDPEAKSILEKCARENFGVTGTDATSYTGYYTNIHWLSTLYKKDIPVDKGFFQSAVYIEGIGTETGKPDSLLGQSLGTSDTGVIAKTDKAVAQLSNVLNQSIRDIKKQLADSGIVIKSLHFDIFGFSRGAAAARHFANRIQSEEPAIISAIRQGVTGVTFKGAPSGRTRFLGIFDTVAAIGTAVNGLNPHSADTGEVNLRLRPGVAEKVFHITAANECRFNFALNSVKPAWPELALPGAHSDIGGGYLPVTKENLFLTRPATETVPESQPDEATRVYRRAVAQRPALEKYPCLAPLLRVGEISAEAWSDDRYPADRYGQMQKRSYAALALRGRIVRNDWSRVALRVMLEAAQEAGVVFDPIDPENPNMTLSDELSSLCDKALAMGKAARGGRTPQAFSQEELVVIAQKYIHCSANWNAVAMDTSGLIHGGTSLFKLISFINRPDEGWQRTIYNMDGKKI